MSICHRCEGDLRQAADISASPSEINATFLIFEKCGTPQCYGEQRWPEKLARFSIGESIEFLGALEKLNSVSRNFGRPARAKKGAANNLSAGARLLEDWPENLFRILDIILYNRSLAKGENGSFLELNRVGFIESIQDKFKHCSPGPASSMDEALINYLSSIEEDYRDGGLDARFAGMRGSERTSIRISDLARRSRVLSGPFEDIALYNEARKMWTRHRFKSGSLRRDETEIIFEQELLTMCQSARFLGISRSSLRGLIARRTIIPAKFRTRLGTHICFFSQADVQATIDAIHSRFLPSPAAPGNLDFRAMLFKIRAHGVKLGDVLHSIMSGGLAVRGWNIAGSGLNCASFNDREIAKTIDLFCSQPACHVVSMRRTSVILGLPFQVVKELVNRGHMSAKKISNRLWEFELGHVIEFRRTYMHKRQIEKEFDLRFAKFSLFVQASRLETAFQVTFKGNAILFFARATIEQKMRQKSMERKSRSVGFLQE